MRQAFDLDLIFPIKDQPSAALMALKAALLFGAGVISAADMATVLQRALLFSDIAPKQVA